MCVLFFVMLRPPPISTLFPYTTLFRSSRATPSGSGNRRAATRTRTPCRDRKSTRLNSSHGYISYAVFCLKKKIVNTLHTTCALFVNELQNALLYDLR